MTVDVFGLYLVSSYQLPAGHPYVSSLPRHRVNGPSLSELPELARRNWAEAGKAVAGLNGTQNQPFFEGLCITGYLPRTQLTSIFEGQPSKTRPKLQSKQGSFGFQVW